MKIIVIPPVTYRLVIVKYICKKSFITKVVVSLNPTIKTLVSEKSEEKLGFR